MPRRARGPRIALTIRLPYDIYREVCVRAEARNWSLSDFVSFCVAKEISGKFRKTGVNPMTGTHGHAAADDWFGRLDVTDEVANG